MGDALILFVGMRSRTNAVVVRILGVFRVGFQVHKRCIGDWTAFDSVALILDSGADS